MTLPPTSRPPRRPVGTGPALLVLLVSACGGDTEPVRPPAPPEVPGEVPDSFAVAVAVTPVDAGTSTGAGLYEDGDTATVSVVPERGYRLSRWAEGGEEVGTAATHSFVVTRDVDLVAELALEAFPVTVRADPTNGGVVAGGGVFSFGSSVRVEADPAPGHLFGGWLAGGGLQSQDPEFSFEVTEALELEARFPLDTARGGWSPGGTYSDWYFPEGAYESLEWTFLPVADPPESLADKGLLHYYAYTFAVTHASGDVGGGYAGFQTNGIIFGQYRGKVVNFSIWGSNGGRSDGWVQPSNSESGGHQIMYPYPWIEGGAYRFELGAGPGGEDPEGKWWGLWVTDLTSGQTTFVGEQRVPARIGGRDARRLQPHTAMFGEDLHWWRTLPGWEDYHCGEFEPSSMAAVEVTADAGAVQPDRVTTFTNAGQVAPNQRGRSQTNCAVRTVVLEGGGVQHTLGYWPEPAPLPPGHGPEGPG